MDILRATYSVATVASILCGFYESPNSQNQMCELCTFFQIR